MATAADIEVAVEAAGADEARQELQGVSESIEETADEMGESSSELAGLQRRWSGAFTAMTAGLAVASGFLLSQVPIIGEVMAGFGAIVEAVAFQMDQLLRPVFGPIVDLMFDLADAIFELDGIAGDLVGLLGVLAIVIGALAVAGKVTGGLISLGGALAAAKVAVSALVAGIAVLVGSLSAPVVAIAAVVAAVIILIEYFVGWGNIINATIDLINDLIGWLQAFAAGTWEATLDLIGDAQKLLADSWDALVNITDGIWQGTLNLLGDGQKLLADAWDTLVNIVGDSGGETWEFTLDLIGDAQKILADVWDMLVDIAGDTVDETWSAFLFIFGGALDFVEDVLDTLQKIVAKTWDAVVEIAVEIGEILGISGDDFADPGDLDDGFLPDLTQFIPSLQEGGILQSDGLFYGHAGEAVVPPDAGGDADVGLQTSQTGSTSSNAPFLANQAQSINVNIDGREVARATKQYEDRDTSVRGRFGSSG